MGNEPGGSNLQMKGNESIQQKFTEALAALVEQVKGDNSVLAASLCGSLSYNTVCEV
jgi:hypothetical protein